MAQYPKTWPRVVQALVQSGMVALFVLLAFFAVYRFHSKLAVASLAASAFIAFGFPASASAQNKVLLGGYACGVVCGAVSCVLLGQLQRVAGEHLPLTILFCALAVLLTAFSMIMLKVQHPPATALAVSMVLEPSPWVMGLTVMLCMLALCGLKTLAVRFLGKRFS